MSLVIPCLNAEEVIGTQLEALAGQDYAGSWELIVADNGSTDDSRAVIADYQDRIPGLQIVDASARTGQAYARNIGARAATGDVLLFLDADDEASPTWLSAMARALEHHDFVTSRIDFARLNPQWVADADVPTGTDDLMVLDFPPYLPHGGGCGLGVKRSVHEAVGGFEESWPEREDTEYCVRVQLAGTPLTFVPDACVYVRLRNSYTASFMQRFRWGVGSPRLYAKYGFDDPAHTPLKNGASAWLSLVRHARFLWKRQHRWAFVTTAGYLLGRLEGSIRHRRILL